LLLILHVVEFSRYDRALVIAFARQLQGRRTNLEEGSQMVKSELELHRVRKKGYFQALRRHTAFSVRVMSERER
jgi:hypothetical protein